MFKKYDIVFLYHRDYKNEFVPMQIIDIKIMYNSSNQFSLKSIDEKFIWVTRVKEEFILNSEKFGKNLNLIDKNYQKKLEKFAENRIAILENLGGKK